MFPLKFELYELLNDYLDSKYGKNTEQKEANKYRISQHLFTIYLSLISSKADKRLEIYNKISSDSKFSHYNTNPRPEQLEYIFNLPPENLTKEDFTEDEFKFFEYSGITIDRQTSAIEVHQFLLNNLNKKPFLEVYKDVISNYDTYSYWYGIVSSRSFKVSLEEYEYLYNIKLVNSEKGSYHVNLINEITKSK